MRVINHKQIQLTKHYFQNTDRLHSYDHLLGVLVIFKEAHDLLNVTFYNFALKNMSKDIYLLQQKNIFNSNIFKSERSSKKHPS